MSNLDIFAEFVYYLQQICACGFYIYTIILSDKNAMEEFLVTHQAEVIKKLIFLSLILGEHTLCPG